MSDPVTIATRRREVEERRAALIATARDLQARLQPATLAGEAWQRAKAKGADLAEDAVDAVRSRPVAAGGAIAALALFLARDPLKDGASALLHRLKDGKEKKAARRVDSDKTPAKPKAPRPPSKPARAAKGKATPTPRAAPAAPRRAKKAKP